MKKKTHNTVSECEEEGTKIKFKECPDILIKWDFN